MFEAFWITQDEKLFLSHKLGEWQTAFGKFQHRNLAQTLLAKLNDKFLQLFAWQTNLVKSTLGVNFINILRTLFCQ